VSADVEARWRELERSEEVITGMAEWRAQHPRATWKESAAALDERLAQVRARMLHDTVLASAATDVRQLPVDERPRCPECGPALEARGQEERTVRPPYERAVTLRRS
jgi:hypothetical protein